MPRCQLRRRGYSLCRADEREPLLGSTDQVAADLDQAAKLGIEHVYWKSDDDPLSQLPLLERLRRG
jgi:hypothetical protein